MNKETIKAFYFTFGIGHRLVSYCDDTTFELKQKGLSLADKHVIVYARSEKAARETMIRYFAHAWCACWPEFDWRHKIASYTSTLLIELRAE